MNAILALEDGTVFRGHGFGAPASACGEVCFNTSMTGYQEILTDPSYKGQIVTMTYPLIGNYGVNQQDVESWRPHAAGFVIRELSPVVSNWRADYSLSDYLSQNGIPGIQGIDTRALTKKLRVRGALNGFITTEDISEAEALDRAKNWPGLVGVDYVKEVTHRQAFRWDEKDEQSAAFDLVRGNARVDARNHRKPMPPADIPIVAFDYGMKYNILRRLRQHGFAVQVLPATATAADALKYKPAGIFLSNGPGDPEPAQDVVQPRFQDLHQRVGGDDDWLELDAILGEEAFLDRHEVRHGVARLAEANRHLVGGPGRHGNEQRGRDGDDFKSHVP